MEVDETESLQSYSSSSTESRISTNSNESGNYRHRNSVNRPDDQSLIANHPLSPPADQPLKLTKRWQLHHEREEEQQFNGPKNGKLDGTLCKSSHSKLIQNHPELDRLMPATSSSHPHPHLQLTNHHLEPNDYSFSRLLSATEDVAHENHPPNQCVNLMVSESNGALVHGIRPMNGSCQNVENCACHESSSQANADHQRCLKKRKKKKRLTSDLTDGNCFAGGLLGSNQKSTALNSNHLPAAKSSKTNSRLDGVRFSKILNESGKLAGPNGSVGHESGSKLACDNEDAFKSQLHQQLNKLSSYDNDHHYHLQFDSKQQSGASKQKIAKRKNDSLKSKSTNSDQPANGSRTDAPPVTPPPCLITNPTSSAFGTAPGVFQSMPQELADEILHKLNRIPSEPRRDLVTNWFNKSMFKDEKLLNDDLNLGKIQLTANEPRTPRRKHQDSCQTNSSNLTALTDQIMNSDECEDDMDDLIDDEEEIDEENKCEAPRKGLLGGNRAASNDLGKLEFV